MWLQLTSATILAEAGQPPLYISWLASAARLWNDVVAAPGGSVLRQALDAQLRMADAGGTDAGGRAPAVLPAACPLCILLRCWLPAVLAPYSCLWQAWALALRPQAAAAATCGRSWSGSCAVSPARERLFAPFVSLGAADRKSVV